MSLLRAMSRALASAGVAAAGCLPLPGCVLLPLPEHGDGSTPFITADTIEQLAAGRASRADAVMLLGEPSWRGPEDRMLEYHWTANVGFFGVGGYGAPGAGGMISKPRRLCLEFDDAGVLRAKRFHRPGIFGKSAISCASMPEKTEEK